MSKVDVSSKVYSLLNQCPITENQCLLFKSIGLLDNESSIVKSSFSLNEINSKYAEEVLKSIDCLIIEQQKIIYIRSIELEKVKKRYETAQLEYDSQMQQFQNCLSELQQEKSQTNIFSIKKRKELNNSITELKKGIEIFETSHNLQKLKDDYQTAFNKTHSF